MRYQTSICTSSVVRIACAHSQTVRYIRPSRADVIEDTAGIAARTAIGARFVFLAVRISPATLYTSVALPLSAVRRFRVFLPFPTVPHTPRHDLAPTAVRRWNAGPRSPASPK